jgi:hypothetical protein
MSVSRISGQVEKTEKPAEHNEAAAMRRIIQHDVVILASRKFNGHSNQLQKIPLTSGR